VFSAAPVLQLKAVDQDNSSTPAGQIVFSIVSTHNKFTIDPKTGWLATNKVNEVEKFFCSKGTNRLRQSVILSFVPNTFIIGLADVFSQLRFSRYFQHHKTFTYPPRWSSGALPVIEIPSRGRPEFKSRTFNIFFGGGGGERARSAPFFV
jgi:hypothetical protein